MAIRKKNDDVLVMMDNLISKWKDAPQKLFVVDREITVRPKFISISYKEDGNRRIKMMNGAIIDDKKQVDARTSGDDIKNSGFFISALIGDEIQGFGHAYESQHEIPRKTAPLKKQMEISLDNVLKYSLGEYLDLKGESLEKNVDHLFYKLSQDPISEYYAKKIKKTFVRNSVLRNLTAWSKTISSLDYVKENLLTFSEWNKVRRFVDSEGRRIKDSSMYGFFLLELLIKKSNDEVIPYVQRHFWNQHTTNSEMNIDSIFESILSYLEQLKDSSSQISGQYPVILDPGSTGILFHESFAGHALSGKLIKEGEYTTFRGKINQKVAPDFITIIADPQMKNAYGYYKFDEEGVEGRRTVLVENGILRNYLLDRNSAAYFKTLSNGHSRAEWVVTLDHPGEDESEEQVVTPPEPRISNMEIISSKTVPEQELFDHMKRYCRNNGIEFGIYVESGGGFFYPDTSSYEINPRRGWKIYPNGRREAISNFFLVGDSYSFMNQIEYTANNYEASKGFCGAESGEIPTQEIVPSVFIPKVTIQNEFVDRYTKPIKPH